MADSWQDYKDFDHPAILSFIFYPRRDYYKPPDSERSTGFLVPVDEGIDISCRFYFGDAQYANLLFFHGNGELAGEYEDIGDAFNNIGLNLFVADYRGYGSSGGRPSVSGMMRDAHPITKWFHRFLDEKKYPGSRFIMGRSLGSGPAIELAAVYPSDFKGIVIESGFSDVSDLLGRVGRIISQPGQSMPPNPGFDRVVKITMPALVIHGEYDSIVPLDQGQKIFRNLAAADKKMVVIPEADHNTIFSEGMELYLRELGEFVRKHEKNSPLSDEGGGC
jgi:alpha-beta hydrolase superfamily lysophospholipase